MDEMELKKAIRSFLLENYESFVKFNDSLVTLVLKGVRSFPKLIPASVCTCDFESGAETHSETCLNNIESIQKGAIVTNATEVKESVQFDNLVEEIVQQCELSKITCSFFTEICLKNVSYW